jgi:Ubiquitin-protein ligase
MRYVLESLISILIHPAPEHALEADIAAEMINNPSLFHQNAQEWVRNFAK